MRGLGGKKENSPSSPPSRPHAAQLEGRWQEELLLLWEARQGFQAEGKAPHPGGGAGPRGFPGCPNQRPEGLGLCLLETAGKVGHGPRARPATQKGLRVRAQYEVCAEGRQVFLAWARSPGH